MVKMGWFSSVKTSEGIDEQVWTEHMLISLSQVLLLARTGVMDACPTLRYGDTSREHSDLHICWNFIFLPSSPHPELASPYILYDQTLWSYQAEWEEEPQFVKPLPYELHKQMEGFFPLTSNRRLSLDHKQVWLLVALLLLSEAYRKHLVKVNSLVNLFFLLWYEFPRTCHCERCIRRPSGEFFFLFNSSFAGSLLVYWCRCSGNVFNWKKVENKLRANTMDLKCYISWCLTAEQQSVLSIEVS